MHRALIALTLAALPLAAFADVYRSVDAQGHVQYSDTYSPGAQLISTAEDISAAAAADAQRSAGQLEQHGDEISDQLANDAAARQVAKDKADAQAAQCKQATQAYQSAIQARRLYTMAADGQRQYMSDEQADQQRVAYKQAMDAACQDQNSQ
jgi:hypothetical protein